MAAAATERRPNVVAIIIFGLFYFVKCCVVLFLLLILCLYFYNKFPVVSSRLICTCDDVRCVIGMRSIYLFDVMPSEEKN